MRTHVDVELDLARLAKIEPIDLEAIAALQLERETLLAAQARRSRFIGPQCG